MIKAGSKLVCPSCGDHVMTFIHDINDGDILHESSVNQTDGQAPWLYGAPLICKKCSAYIRLEPEYIRPTNP